jgi:hypothetical protein
MPTPEQIRNALVDLLDGTKGAAEIEHNTGLSPARCQEIWDLYCQLLNERLGVPGWIRTSDDGRVMGDGQESD